MNNLYQLEAEAKATAEHYKARLKAGEDCMSEYADACHDLREVQEAIEWKIRNNEDLD